MATEDTTTAMSPMIAHVVGLKFVPGMSEEDIAHHFETEVALHERMPELVPSRAHWRYSKNQSGPLFDNDRGAALNNGCEYVVVVWLQGRDAMLKYEAHPKHQELMALQAAKLTADMMVLDPVVSVPEWPPRPGAVMHVVGLRFVDGLSHAEIERHFEVDVALDKRMPELIPSRNHWCWCQNQSGPLFHEDCGAGLNHGSEYVVVAWLTGREAMLQYGPHPKHQELMALQAERFLASDGKCVLDAG